MMYFPYLRGRQFELLALKELVSKKLINEKIIPIIEPIKVTPTLINTINEFIKNNRRLAIIINPQVGDCTYNTKELNNLIYSELNNNDIVLKTIIVQKDFKTLFNNLTNQKNDLICIVNNKDYIDTYLDTLKTNKPTYTLTLGDRSYTRKLVNSNKVLFEDHFNKKDRNSDYIQSIDEPFSEDHLFYKEEGFVGFSDYSIIGSGFQESGFAPYAVAIHIVYFDANNGLRVKHFVSKTNEDISNPALKYYEAVSELSKWYERAYNNKKTFGLENFYAHYKEGSYPGLGTVKKLSLMHHLELISSFLEIEKV